MVVGKHFISPVAVAIIMVYPIIGGGVVILVTTDLQCLEPEELKTDSDMEMIWVQITVTGTSHLYVGDFYHPPKIDSPDYLASLDNAISRIPLNAHVWLSGDFNIGDIDWAANCTKGSKI